jgi:hypothetical protein
VFQAIYVERRATCARPMKRCTSNRESAPDSPPPRPIERNRALVARNHRRVNTTATLIVQAPQLITRSRKVVSVPTFFGRVTRTVPIGFR